MASQLPAGPAAAEVIFETGDLDVHQSTKPGIVGCSLNIRDGEYAATILLLRGVSMGLTMYFPAVLPPDRQTVDIFVNTNGEDVLFSDAEVIKNEDGRVIVFRDLSEGSEPTLETVLGRLAVISGWWRIENAEKVFFEANLEGGRTAVDQFAFCVQDSLQRMQNGDFR